MTPSPRKTPDGRVLRLITHLHSRASDGAASPLYPYVQSGLVELLGPRGESVEWLESIITPKTIERLLAGRFGAVDLVCLTDHVSARLHRLRPEYLALAQAHAQLIMGSEVSTHFWSPERGRYVEGPDLLVYGPPALRREPGQAPYFGLTQDDLDALYEACLATTTREPDTLRVIDWVNGKGYAWAVAHPLDGNELTLTELFSVFARAKAIEILNGGFPEASHLALKRYLPLHNQLVADRTGCEAGQNALAEALCASLEATTPRPLLALGGSDAHVSNFHRALTLMRVAEMGSAAPAELFLRALLGQDRNGVELSVLGRGTSWLRLYGEAARVVVLNFWKNRRLIVPSLPRVSYVTARIVKERLSTYEKLGQTRLEQLRAFRLAQIPESGS